MAMISIRNLCKNYGENQIFDNFNLDVFDGEVLAILGESGSGKTTLLNVLAGLTDYEGQVDGVEKPLSMVFQKDMLVKSRKLRDSKIVEADSISAIMQGVENKNFVKAGWCGDRECEDKIKEQTGATARVMVDEEGIPEVCPVCGKKAKHKVVFARAY